LTCSPDCAAKITHRAATIQLLLEQGAQNARASAVYCYLSACLSGGAAVAAWYWLPSPFLIGFAGAGAFLLAAAGFWHNRVARKNLPPTAATFMKSTIALSILCLVAAASAPAESIVFRSGDQQVSLLELYTSEGCSSCPPAEAWLSKLKTAPGLWSKFVPAAFHVDYWNNLGWRDKLSSEQFSDRQRSYAHAWSAENIYTPEFVLNGREWHNWFGFRGIPSASATKAGVLQTSSTDGKHWQANFVPAEKGTADYEVTAALLVSDLASDVTAGENSGRHLNHDFAVLSLITRPLTSQNNGFQGTFIIDPHPKGITGRFALAMWVTSSGQLEPLQAAGGWLPEPAKMTLSSNQPTQK